jgi:hypothetical protein
MKLEHNCVIFKPSGQCWTFHVTDIESLYHYIYCANGDLEHRVVLLRKTSPSGSSTYEFVLPEGSSIQEIAQFIDSVCTARRDFNANLNPTHTN